MNLWGDLTILDGLLALGLVGCVYVYVRRLENRTPAALGEQVGAHKAILAKLRRREPMTPAEFEYATELVEDARSPLAYAIPAVLFSCGFFYVVGCLYELHVHGGNPSFRTFIGGIPMLSSMNIVGQLRRVARHQSKLADIEIVDDADTATHRLSPQTA
ncbi:uncharacterized protein RMCC_0864 [Mycolicibacterium canariasense]|uniref:Transmembrane protein n=1 Tax=Mycolicibacterium canariasense TaxID=228230 RepID=A0A100W9E4_MYCCR|nr:hypothetical protein [Mycolicibacterium canariasense]MCV7212923.1 hypothetical protein [Mycolicibacterium canariasense]GAS93898.1 uncharacterized protein RMCC_0864 [Mycolicibacterium canariasense]